MIKSALHLFMLLIVLNIKLFGQSNIILKLHQEINNNINFPEDLVEYQLRGMQKLKKYNDFILKNYKGIPVLDSLKIHVFYIEDTKFLYDLYKSGNFEKTDFNNFVKKFNIDTLTIFKDKLKQNLVSLVGFKGNKQILISDSNNNFDFNDDVKYEFNVNFSKYSLSNLKLINKLPVSKFVYEYTNNGIVGTINRKFVTYPNTNHYFKQRLDKSDKNYLSFIKFVDYWKGFTKYKKTTFDFYVQANSNKDALIYITNEKVKLSKSDQVYNR